VADIPHRLTDPATVMPVQIYLWASNPEAGFVERTSAGILVLLLILIVMNSAAIYVRKRFELRW
jgi:phosphate transport system permease protein